MSLLRWKESMSGSSSTGDSKNTTYGTFLEPQRSHRMTVTEGDGRVKPVSWINVWSRPHSAACSHTLHNPPKSCHCKCTLNEPPSIPRLAKVRCDEKAVWGMRVFTSAKTGLSCTMGSTDLNRYYLENEYQASLICNYRYIYSNMFTLRSQKIMLLHLQQASTIPDAWRVDACIGQPTLQLGCQEGHQQQGHQVFARFVETQQSLYTTAGTGVITLWKSASTGVITLKPHGNRDERLGVSFKGEKVTAVWLWSLKS